MMDEAEQLEVDYRRSMRELAIARDERGVVRKQQKQEQQHHEGDDEKSELLKAEGGRLFLVDHDDHVHQRQQSCEACRQNSMWTATTHNLDDDNDIGGDGDGDGDGVSASDSDQDEPDSRALNKHSEQEDAVQLMNEQLEEKIIIKRHNAFTFTVRIQALDDAALMKLCKFLSTEPVMRCLSKLHIRHAYRMSDYHLQVLVGALRTHSQRRLHTLCIAHNQIGDGGVRILSQLLHINSSITYLDLKRNYIQEEGIRHLIGAMRSPSTISTSISHLDLAENSLGSRAITQLCHFFSGRSPPSSPQTLSTTTANTATAAPSSLTWLSLSKTQCSENGAASIAEMLMSSNSALRHLDLTLNKCGVLGARHIASALIPNTTLEILSLGGNDIGNDGAIALSAALFSNKKLSSLDVSANNIGGAGVKALCEALQQNNTIKKLNISWNPLDKQAITELSSYIKTNKCCLTKLNLRNCSIGDSGIGQIASALRVNQSIEWLDLTLNRISEKGADSLASLLSVNETLTTVGLRYNHIEDKGAARFARMLRKNKTLHKLDLTHNSISFEAAHSILDSLLANKGSQLFWLGNPVPVDVARHLERTYQRYIELCKLTFVMGFHDRAGNSSVLKNQFRHDYLFDSNVHSLLWEFAFQPNVEKRL